MKKFLTTLALFGVIFTFGAHQNADARSSFSFYLGGGGPTYYEPSPYYVEPYYVALPRYYVAPRYQVVPQQRCYQVFDGYTPFGPSYHTECY